MTTESISSQILLQVPAGTAMEYERADGFGTGRDSLLTTQVLDIYVDPGTNVSIGSNKFILVNDSEAPVPEMTHCGSTYELPEETEVALSIGFNVSLPRDMTVQLPAEMKVKLPVNTKLVQLDSEKITANMTLTECCNGVISTSPKSVASKNRIFIAKSNNVIDVIDATSMTLLRSLQSTTESSNYNIISLSPNGTLLACACAGKITIWNTLTYTELHKLNVCEPISSLCFSPDGKQIMIITSTGCHIWSVDGRHMLNIENVNAACFSADNAYIIAATDGQFDVIDAKTYDTIRTVDIGANHIIIVQSSSDGKYIYAATSDRLYKYEIFTGKIINSDHIYNIRCYVTKNIEIACRPRSDQIALAVSSSATANLIKLWDTASSNCEKLIGPTAQQHICEDSHNGHVKSIAYSPDGSHIVSGGDDNKVIIWDADAKTHCRSYNADAHVVGVCWC